MSDHQNIEELFRSKLGDAELTPSQGAWKGVQRKMRMEQFLRFDVRHFNIFYLGVILVVGLTAVALLSKAPSAGANYEQEETAVLEGLQDTKSPMNAREENGSNERARAKGAEEQISSGQSDKPAQEEKQKGSISVSETDNPTEGQDARLELKVEVRADDMGEQDFPKILPILVPGFMASHNEGCVPLKVKFINSSENAAKASWSFGNGEQSQEFSPEYLYEEAGVYNVAMNVLGIHGDTAIHRQVIKVYPSPVAGFEMGEGLEGAQGSISMELMNYSTGGYSYSWEFLSANGKQEKGWFSNEFQPIVTNREIPEEARSIRMVALNEYGCTDTTIAALHSMNGAERTLLFPTVFRANNTGPTGGYYSQHEMRRDIFHPHYSEDPAEYQLRVYSKMGELVFETNEISQGWDGYHQQERTAGGVYMWLVEGSWQNGTSFNQRGDVTLLWNEWR